MNEEEKKKFVMDAFKTAKSNSYLRCLSGDLQLFYMFMEGYTAAKTGKLPEDLLDNKEFLSDPQNYFKK